MKKKQTILAAAAVLILLAAAFWYGGDAPGLQGWTLSASSDTSQPPASAPSGSASSAAAAGAGSASSLDKSGEETPSARPEDSSALQNPTDHAQGQDPPDQSAPAPDTSSHPEETTPPTAPQPEPESPASSQNTPPEEQATTCSISIVCTTVLDHLDWLTPGKEDILPAGGVMLAATEVEPQEGETVFSLLQRITRENGIPMEASFTPGTGSAYVEGIGNLYEFDCGQRSGWLYFVNGISPGYSCSEYTLKPGDRVEWVYTCDLGQDVGATVAGG